LNGPGSKEHEKSNLNKHRDPKTTKDASISGEWIKDDSQIYIGPPHKTNDSTVWDITAYAFLGGNMLFTSIEQFKDGSMMVNGVGTTYKGFWDERLHEEENNFSGMLESIKRISVEKDDQLHLSLHDGSTVVFKRAK